MNARFPLVLVLTAVLAGCSRTPDLYEATIDVFVLADVSGDRPFPETFSTNWFSAQQRVIASDEVLGPVVDELRLTEQWGSPGKPLAREASIERVRSSLETSRAEGSSRLELKVKDSDIGRCEDLAVSVAKSFQRLAREDIHERAEDALEKRRKEMDEIQTRMDALTGELQAVQKDLYVPSRYQLSPEYEARLQEQIRTAQAEEAERTRQLESLRQLKGDDLRAALTRIEMSRVAAAKSATNVVDSPSMLLTIHREQKAAQSEFESLRQSSADTNAVAHARLKLEQADQNLASIMNAVIQTLEIELDVTRTRRKELEGQLEKLRETGKRSAEKNRIEKDITALKTSLADLTDQVEQWERCRQLIDESVRVGEVNVQAVRRE